MVGNILGGCLFESLLCCYNFFKGHFRYCYQLANDHIYKALVECLCLRIYIFLHCNDAWSKYSLKFFADLYLLCIDSVFKLIDVGRILQVYSSIPFHSKSHL